MYDAGKILAGLCVFLCVLALPIWYNSMTGRASFKPEPKIIGREERCVEQTSYMRAHHMTLLNSWRNAVVRQGDGMYETADGRKYDMSLTRTCMNCHSNKADFCDQCHNYLGVQPYCWDCHTYPKGK